MTPPPRSPPSEDPRSGFCAATKSFHSLRPPIPLPPDSLPLSFTTYAFSLLPSPPPSYPALVDSATAFSISFAELLSRVRSLAASLRPLAPAGRVAFVLAPATLDIPVLYLALLSLGVVVAPANPAATPAELSRLVSLARPSVAFATSSTARKLPAELTAVLLDSPQFRSLLALPVGPAAADTADEVRLCDPAAVLYSSGTTGPVKGVLLTHRNFVAQTLPFRSMHAGRRSPAVQMVTAPLFHVYGFVFSLKGVVTGETTVIMTKTFDARRLVGDVHRFRVTHLALAPPALSAVLRACEDGDTKCELGSLEAVSCGGAPIGMELIGRFVARFPNVLFAQGYGLTESTSGVFRNVGPEESQRLGSTGRLVSNCEAKIVDPLTGISLPPCMQGELWLRGPTIMKGYIGDAEASSAVLDSEGWLKTGDLCFIDEDGFLFIVDRLKELIKYKGYQVPPAELEDLLQRHEDIIEAAVVPCPDMEAGEVPMAFVVRQTQSTLSEAQIMEFVAKQVAPYKKVRRVSFINSIPRNAAGKILRKDLVRLAALELNSVNSKL